VQVQLIRTKPFRFRVAELKLGGRCFCDEYVGVISLARHLVVLFRARANLLTKRGPQGLSNTRVCPVENLLLDFKGLLSISYVLTFIPAGASNASP
jgi:hypothetical protein